MVPLAGFLLDFEVYASNKFHYQVVIRVPSAVVLICCPCLKYFISCLLSFACLRLVLIAKLLCHQVRETLDAFPAAIEDILESLAEGKFFHTKRENFVSIVAYDFFVLRSECSFF
jgi:hypothetical protein